MRKPLFLNALVRFGLLGALTLLSACQTAPLVPAQPMPPVVVAPAVPTTSQGTTTPQPAAVVLAPRPPPKPPRIGLALGGGAARGFAHIGVIQVLEAAGIRPDLVVGTSAGSLVAALYASGKNGAELETLALTMDEGAITDWAFPSRGMIRGEALARFVREHTGGQPIEKMKHPLGIVATDLDNGLGVLFQRGDLGTAVRASSSVPAVFQPVKIGEREYVDGGLVAPVPVRYARQMGAELVLAVDISSPPDGQPTTDTMKLLLQTFAIMGKSINRFELREADVVVRPPLLGVSSADFTSRVRAIRSGREAATEMLPALKARIAALTR
jgi:NTE family protein